MRTRLLLLLAAVTAWLHFFRLSEPPSVVFDEVHFGRFVSAYSSGEYFFDIHPPHAKLLVAGAAALGGYRGTQDFAVIHRRITEVSPAMLRCVPALAGSLVPLLAFALLSQLGARPFAAFLGGLALALDNGLLIQTRILALDGVLLAATLGALCCYLAALTSPRAGRRALLALSSGALAGLAAGSKFTGLAALVLVGVCGLGAWLRDRRAARLRALAGDAVLVSAAALAVYAAGWALHFALLPLPGPGDVWGAPTGHWLSDTISVHRRMLGANANLQAGHPYASPWWSWPFMRRPVSYWSEDNRHLFFLGNPIVWWGSTLALLLALLLALVSRPLLAVTRLEIRGEARAWPQQMWIPLCGFAVAFAPLAGVARILFLYHYLMPLVFAVCASALWLDHVGWTRSGGWNDQRRSVRLAIAALLVGFAAICPFTLSYVHAPAYQSAVFRIFPSWR